MHPEPSLQQARTAIHPKLIQPPSWLNHQCVQEGPLALDSSNAALWQIKQKDNTQIDLPRLNL